MFSIPPTRLNQNVLVGSLDFEDQVWQSVSDLAKDFVSQLLEYEEDKRPTAQKALSHPWLEQLRSGTFVKPIDATAIRKTRPATRDALVGLANFSSSQSKLKQVRVKIQNILQRASIEMLRY